MGPRSAFVAAVLMFSGARAPAATPACEPDPAKYSREGYQVGKIIITSPLDFFQAVSSVLHSAKKSLPLTEGAPFTAAAYSAGVEILAHSVKRTLGETSRVKVVVVTASLENCRNQTLDAVYHVFAFNFPSFAAPRTEIRREEIERPAPAAAESNVQGNYFTAPLMGYNASRHFFGGMAGSVATRGGIFNSLKYAVSGSGSSSSAGITMAGARDVHSQFLDHADYQVGYLRSNMPSILATLEKAAIQARFSGSSKPYARVGVDGEAGLTAQFRYAASLEGGNQQTTFGSTDATLGSSPSGAFKLALGATVRNHRQSAAISYGLQLGATQAAAELDYVKHVLDGEWNGTVDWPWNFKKQDLHYPIHLQVRGGWGKLLVNNRVPLPERFYGGNSVESFLPGSDWDIRGGPFIRSIAQNRLAGMGTGGDSFRYISFTVAPTTWALPLVPRSLTRNPAFQSGKQEALDDAVTIEKLFFEAQDPAAQNAAKDLDGMKPVVERLHDLVAGLEGKIPTSAESARAKAEQAAGRALRAMVSARSDPSKLSAVPGNVATLRRDVQALNALIAPLPDLHSQHDELAKNLAALEAQAAKLSTDMKEIDVAGAEAKAKKDLAAVRPILDTFLNELNGLALSPVLMADVASLHPDPFGTHYALGFGLRFTFLNINLTAGYAINPHPHPEPTVRQGHGALFFSFEVSDLFR